MKWLSSIAFSFLMFSNCTSYALTELEQKTLRDHLIFKSKFSSESSRVQDIDSLREEAKVVIQKLNLKIKLIKADIKRLQLVKIIWTRIKHNPYTVATKWLQQNRKIIEQDCCRMFKDPQFAKDRLLFIERRASERKLRILRNTGTSLDDG